MKIFYKENYLASCLNGAKDDLYEIRAPYDISEEIADDGRNVICLWDEEKYGSQYKFRFFCGETIAGEELYTSEVEEYLYKINEAVGEETAIGVLVTDSVYSHQLLDYFVNMKKEKDFRIHVFMNTEIPVREGNERLMLTYLEHIKELDSVAFFNRAGIEMMNLHEIQSIELWAENLEACRELAAEEAAKAMELVADLPKAAEEELWFYYPQNCNYEKIMIQESDCKIEPSQREAFYERIAPNSGKETCKRLKNYRLEFKRKHGVKSKEYACTYTGECQGSCAKCDAYGEELWEKVYGEQLLDPFGEAAQINGLIRLREHTDGPGIRTLVVMNDCHLDCAYCINKEYINLLPMNKKMTSCELTNRIEKDAVYFEMTGGGVTFGGGEPLLAPAFIKSFKEKNPSISIAVETSLNVPKENVAMLTEIVDDWIVDIKDMNNDIYAAYTGTTNEQVIENLGYLIAYVPVEHIRCRIPEIPGYNTSEDVTKSMLQLKEMGIIDTECFTYRIPFQS